MSIYICIAQISTMFLELEPDLSSLVLKSVRVHFAYGRIALKLELLGRFGRFLDENDLCNPPVLFILFSRLFGP